MQVDVLPQELRRGRREPHLALFATLAENLEVPLVHVVKGEPAQFADADPRVEEQQHQNVVAEAQRR